ncbi:hypothetical protein J7J18_01575 [bacterium]|nr:hypothetical protein [bacterium]
MVEVTEEMAINWFMEEYKDEIPLGDNARIRIVVMGSNGLTIYTPAQLLEEMKKRTPIGVKFIKIFMDYLRYKLTGEV